MFTTSSHSLDKQFAAEHNAGFITKPIDVGQLNIIISHFIDNCEENAQAKVRKDMSRAK